MEENELDSDWELIHSPFTSGEAKRIGDGSNSLVIKDDFFRESPSAFPPGNHEDLPVGSPGDGNRQLSEPEPDEREPEPLTPPSDGDDSVRGWKRLQFGVLRARILQVVHKVRKHVACRAGLCSFAWTAGGAAAVLLFISFLSRRMLIWWRRRVERNSNKENLKFLIREKDKKINQLVLQIAQMNEALRAPRRVPVIRVK